MAVAAGCAALAMAAMGGVGAAPAFAGAHARGTYLALGDSLAFGYSQARFEALAPEGDPAAGFDTGYVDDFAAYLRNFQQHLQVVNDGCPGETTDSMIEGPCAYGLAYPLHHPYSGSQLADALAVIHERNPNNVTTITIDIGANDAIGVAVKLCKLEPACVAEHAEALLAHIGSNVAFILGQLRTAAPRATIIVVGFYDPFAVLAETEEEAQRLNALTENLNAVLAQVAAGAGALFANTFPVFNVGGTLEAEKTSLCTLTFMCTHSPPDIHATDLGYEKMAEVIEGVYAVNVHLPPGLMPAGPPGRTR